MAKEVLLLSGMNGTANTLGMESEIWEYNKDLSGLPAEIKAAERQ
jgi:hypothetical protein